MTLANFSPYAPVTDVAAISRQGAARYPTDHVPVPLASYMSHSAVSPEGASPPQNNENGPADVAAM